MVDEFVIVVAAFGCGDSGKLVRSVPGRDPFEQVHLGCPPRGVAVGHRVGAVATLDHVVAASRRQVVIARPATQQIGAVAAREAVIAGVAIEEIVSSFAFERVVADAAEEVICAGSSIMWSSPPPPPITFGAAAPTTLSSNGDPMMFSIECSSSMPQPNGGAGREIYFDAVGSMPKAAQSTPRPPSMTSSPGPPTRVSSPPYPQRVSLPSPPTSRSLPPNPTITSFPSVPFSTSLPDVPTTVAGFPSHNGGAASAPEWE